MNADRWTKIETLIEQALELAPEEQTAFIENECGTDGELKKEITSLLQYKEQAFSFIRDISENVVPPSFAEKSKGTDGEDSRINTVIGHYHITDILGRGGMGVVYKARDTKLDRTVALKFLPSHLTRSEKDKQRFIREAKAAAALNHPNICTIHSVEEYEGQHFISMEYIDGQTLREKLESEDITPEKALEYAIRIAGALTEAHEKDIVHRDIKPGNIMVDSKNRIKVTDFGLAKFRNGSRITKEGTTLGTVQYMSPEQANGKEVDHRTDIWSLGVVVYEMLSGKPPFDGEHDQAVIYSILNKDPEWLPKTDTQYPEELNNIILKCLVKDPNERYLSAGELTGDLQRLRSKPSDIHMGRSNSLAVKLSSLTSPPALAGMATGVFALLLLGYWLFPTLNSPGPPADTKIAVLPLQSFSQDPSDIQFTDGVHEELINRLAGIGDLTVIARSSALNYPPGNRNLQSIGEELGVSSLIEGTVRRFGDQLKISVQLVDANNSNTLWSGSFGENIDNVFEIQSRIARQVASELHTSLTEEEQERLEERPTDNPDAYQFYVQAREYLSRSIFNEENHLTALRLLRRATEEDREFAHAWAMKTVAYSRLYWFHGKTSERLKKMKETADWAHFINPDLPETYLANGLYLYWSESNYEQTLSHLNEALNRFPNQSLLHLITGLTHRRLGNWNQMEHHLATAVELNPRNPDYYGELSFYYYLTRNFEKAETLNDQAIQLSPSETSQPWLMKAVIGLERNGTFEDYEAWWNYIKPSNPAEVEPFFWGRYNLLKRDWEEALHGFKNIPTTVAWQSDLHFHLKDYWIAVTLDYQGKRNAALEKFKQVQNFLNKLINEYPEDPRYRLLLGKVYARMDELELAILEGEKAIKLSPASKNAIAGPHFQYNLAEIYAWCGLKERAIDILEYVLSVPSMVHKNYIKFDPIWDPLRDHPRFQELIAEEDEPYLKDI